MRTNSDRLVEMLLQCRPGQPRTRGTFQVDHRGAPFLLPSIGGITLNVLVGDSAFGLAGDHIEPAVSCNANSEKRTEFPNDSLQLFGCIGNRARIVSGRAEGVEGVVTGKHSGSEHLMIDFPVSAMEKMTYDDIIMVISRGQGLKLLDYPDITCLSLDPDLLAKMNLQERDGHLVVPVTAMAPAHCMGSGVGSTHAAAGDYDIMTSDRETVAAHHLEKLRIGDIVALQDHDNAYGRAYRRGAVTIGVVVHGDSFRAGHGPGVAAIMTCPVGTIVPRIDSGANIAELLEIGRLRR